MTKIPSKYDSFLTGALLIGTSTREYAGGQSSFLFLRITQMSVTARLSTGAFAEALLYPIYKGWDEDEFRLAEWPFSVFSINVHWSWTLIFFCLKLKAL